MKANNSDMLSIHPHSLPAGTRVFTYARISPGDNQTIESQTEEIERFCKEKGWIIVKNFKDSWKSGKSTEGREDFEFMMYMARNESHLAQAVVFVDSSRFGRGDPTETQFYRAELRHHGFHVVSIKDDIPTGPLAVLFEFFIDLKNHLFLSDLREHTRRGLRYIAEHGCLPVGTVCPGYKTDDYPLPGKKKDGSQRNGRKPIIDPEKAPLTIKAWEMKAQGAPNKEIAKKTKLFPANSGSWNHFFTERAYIGEYEIFGQVYTNIYPPIISKELFDAVQKLIIPRKPRLSASRTHPRRARSNFFLANLAVCAYCGKPMEGKRVHAYRYYVCSAHNTPNNQCLCSKASVIPANAVEDEVVRILLDHILKEEYMKALLSWTNETLNLEINNLSLLLQGLKTNLEQEERALNKFVYNFGMMEKPSSAAEKMLHEQEEKVLAIRAEAALVEHEIFEKEISITQEQIQNYLSNMRALIENGDPFDLRSITEKLCSKIIMGREEIKIEIHFPLFHQA